MSPRAFFEHLGVPTGKYVNETEIVTPMYKCKVHVSFKYCAAFLCLPSNLSLPTWKKHMLGFMHQVTKMTLS